jgi:hypothetical protein
MNSQQFIYRHSKFPPTLQNIFLLGLAAGAALVGIVVVLISIFSFAP